MTQEYNTRCLTPDFANSCLTLDVSSINSKEIHTYIHIILCIIHTYIHIILCIKDEKIWILFYVYQSWGWGKNKSLCISHIFTFSSFLM